MDADYLKKTIGDALSEGMARVVAQQPADAVDFLGRFLVNYAGVKEKELLAAQAKAKEEQAIALALEIRLKQQKIENEARKAREAKKRQREQILDGLKKSNGVDLAYMQNLINYLQTAIDPTAVYIGRRDKIEGMPDADPDDEDAVSNIILKYVAVSPDSQQFMLSKTLGEKEGVTHAIFKKKEEEEDDDSDYDEDNPKPPKPAPKPGLFLPNVLDNRSVKYFATPKLGSYFAVPIAVASYLHADNQTDDLLQNYKDWLEAVAQRKVELAQRAEEKARKEAEAAALKDEKEKQAAEAKAEWEAMRDAAIEAGEEPPEPPEEQPEEPEEPPEEEAPLEPVPDPKFVPKEVHYVLCVDTLGKGLNCLTEAQLDLLREIAGLLKDAISRTEKASLYKEMQRLVDEEKANASAVEALEEEKKAREEEVQAKLLEMQKAMEEAAEKAKEEGVETAFDEDVALQEALIKLSAAQAAVLAMKSKIAELQRYRLPPKGQSLKVLKCALFTLGYKRDDVRDAHTKKTDWAKMKMNFNNTFFTTLQGYDPAATVAEEGKKKKSKKKGKKGKKKKVQVIPKYRQTASLLALIEGIDLDEINGKSVAVGALLEWCRQVLEVRERAKVKLAKEEEIEAARIAKEEEEEAARKAKEEEEAAAKAAEEAEAAAAEADAAAEES